MVDTQHIISVITRAIPDAQVCVEDLNGGGDHFQVSVVSSSFKDLSLVKQHQLVYGALSNEMANETIHALALNTSVPN